MISAQQLDALDPQTRQVMLSLMEQIRAKDVRLQRGTVSAITLEHCPPSAWNRVRHRVEYAAMQPEN